MLRLFRDASFRYFSVGFLAGTAGFITLQPGSVGQAFETVTRLLV